MKYFLLLFLILVGSVATAQEDSIPQSKELDTLPLGRKIRRAKKKKTKPKDTVVISIKNYQIISHARDTVALDTSLTIQKEYKYNFLRKDDFELMPFANVGQPYNKLGVDFTTTNAYPLMGAKAKHTNYIALEDIKYYNVATPMSDLFFKTTFEQGQLLDATLAFNTSRRLNVSLAFRGFRSLGKYRFNQMQTGNFRATTNFLSKNYRYFMRAHIASQDVKSEENGGITQGETQFESRDDDFTDRRRVDILFEDANNQLQGKRYFLEHGYKLLRKEEDSTITEKTSLAFGHEFNYETKHYKYNQRTPSTFFGGNLISPIEDEANLKTMYNQANVTFYNATLGRLQGNINLYNYNYHFNSVFVSEEGRLDSRLKGEEISIGGNYEKQIKGFKVKGDAKYTIVGDLTGNILNGSAGYRFNENNKIEFNIHSSSRMPDFNYLLFHSDYVEYNWQNTSTFKKQKVYSLGFNFESKFWGNLSGKYTTLDNYTYFGINPEAEIEEGEENNVIKTYQEGGSINHIKLKYNREFKLGGFALNNTVMYQNVSQTNNVLNVPQLVTRNTLYFSSDVFKKAMFIQTGVTLKYFTSYNMDAYNPLLGEFYIQNVEKLGDFPMLDFFINGRVQQTRIYLKAEHFNTLFGKKNSHYAAPNYPYRDFVIRFGIVWNFFS